MVRSVFSFVLVLLASAVTLAQTTYYVSTTGDNVTGDGSQGNPWATIQFAVNSASANDIIIVGDGSYLESITINKNITLLSENGRDFTTIYFTNPSSNLGTIRVTNNTTGVKIGDTEKGFTIIGFDNVSPGLESAAVYFQGSHSNAVIRGNEIVADGEAGLITEFGATISGFVIDGNIFSGKTFVGDNPAGDGFSQQFTLPNVPRQLVVMGGGNGGGNTSNITFTNNQITGTAGGLNVNNNQQGNNLVTLDANGTTILNNTFTGFTNRFAHSLRTRGPNNVIKGNRFIAGSPIGLFVGAPAHNSLINCNIFEGNVAGLVFDISSTNTLNAENNWWGAADGPSGIGPGSGDPVVGNVDFDPWLLSDQLLSVNAGPDQTIYIGYGSPTSATLNAIAEGCAEPFTFLWSTGSTDQSITVSPAVTTTYEVTVTDALGNTASDEVTVNVIDVRCGNKNDKVLVCHNGRTICVSPNAVAAHLAHGDVLGDCDGLNKSPGNYEDEPLAVPDEFMLNMNYPNPFNPSTTVSYQLAADSPVRLEIFNSLGQLVHTLVNEHQPAGYYSVEWNADEFSSGMYILKITATGYTASQKMILMK